LTDDDEAAEMSEEEKIAILPDLHATCAGLKAFAYVARYFLSHMKLIHAHTHALSRLPSLLSPQVCRSAHARVASDGVHRCSTRRVNGWRGMAPPLTFTPKHHQ
jgi:hypothetical protein